MSNPVTTVVDADGIATLTMDLPGKTMNTLGAELTTALATAVDDAAADPAVKGLILTSGKPAFVAGADLKEMDSGSGSRPRTTEELLDGLLSLSRQLRRLETCGKPVACAINGTALGGGLEIALACHYRVVADDPAILLGLPESNVGLLPGGGGTQRLPRLIGIAAALPLLLQGTAMNPSAALKAGVVHAVVPAERLLAEAKRWLLEEGDPVAPWDKKGFTVPGGAGALVPDVRNLLSVSNMRTRANTFGNHPAPAAISAAVYEGTQLPFDTALRLEGKYFYTLFTSPVSKALIRTMFVSKQKADKLAARPAGVEKARYPKIGILGAGTMGAGLALTAAKAGIEVVLLDRDLPSAEHGKAYAGSRLAREVAKGRRTQDKADATLARIHPTTDYADLGDVPLVVEAVFEDRAVKKDVIARADAVLPADAVFASNTSAIPITSLAAFSRRPELFIGAHFFSPVERMALVEIIRGEQTSDATLARTLDLAKALRKTPIVVNDSPGFFTSRFIGSFLTASLTMVNEGVNPNLVENGARMVGMPMGALTISDSVGLDLTVHASRSHGHGGDLGIVGTLVDAGRHGRKNGKGFYDYHDDGTKSLWPGLSDALPTRADQPSIDEVKARILYAQLAEGARAFAEGVLPDVIDGDLGATLGVGFPAHLGGPFVAIDTIGPARFVAECDRLAAAHGEQYALPPLVRDMAAAGQTFYGSNAVVSPGI
ncbi:3-hydroxyacyl-CoA dehydrogenase NAD-binding domain-containing protein [Cryptosporangium aurantiacum]|uniref:3-hydroxyacyl-CoA dehydrogenase / enoyl-CoA hydratase / 3-hydroxybutyryl-CoA epimerase n=1 Tax=Cryptosporangium aurantiacum TaxID=134849 RepID=A0A1M7TYS8_9ACTN|nr:3-hydroxyacyl-CoA dehydrogenase NAD-binding domain-containing protein [Cryptosporangium aurantiacum]SHN75837.1 3-hydroxyacyl-CoA dehydrogenase / enoyl-CoA hydratase / 3-hydroxybutyryl-CoA epimerase [Cryptosporangium aurantiacum]